MQAQRLIVQSPGALRGPAQLYGSALLFDFLASRRYPFVRFYGERLCQAHQVWRSRELFWGRPDFSPTVCSSAGTQRRIVVDSAFIGVSSINVSGLGKSKFQCAPSLGCDALFTRLSPQSSARGLWAQRNFLCKIACSCVSPSSVVFAFDSAGTERAFSERSLGDQTVAKYWLLARRMQSCFRRRSAVGNNPRTVGPAAVRPVLIWLPAIVRFGLIPLIHPAKTHFSRWDEPDR